MRERIGQAVALCVAAYGSPAGIILTTLLCIGGHGYLTATGYLTTAASHYIAGLSELAIVLCAAILYAERVESKALHLKLDALIVTLEGVPSALAGIEDQNERELDEMRGHLLDESESMD